MENFNYVSPPNVSPPKKKLSKWIIILICIIVFLIIAIPSYIVYKNYLQNKLETSIFETKQETLRSLNRQIRTRIPKGLYLDVYDQLEYWNQNLSLEDLSQDHESWKIKNYEKYIAFKEMGKPQNIIIEKTCYNPDCNSRTNASCPLFPVYDFYSEFPCNYEKDFNGEIALKRRGCECEENLIDIGKYYEEKESKTKLHNLTKVNDYYQISLLSTDASQISALKLILDTIDNIPKEKAEGETVIEDMGKLAGAMTFIILELVQHRIVDMKKILDIKNDAELESEVFGENYENDYTFHLKEQIELNYAKRKSLNWSKNTKEKLEIFEEHAKALETPSISKLLEINTYENCFTFFESLDTIKGHGIEDKYKDEGIIHICKTIDELEKENIANVFNEIKNAKNPFLIYHSKMYLKVKEKCPHFDKDLSNCGETIISEERENLLAKLKSLD